MGFIPTGDTTDLSAYLTQLGRELLLVGDEADTSVAYFSLGDSDSNYHVEFSLPEGFVPDIAGTNPDCVISLATNVGIRYNVLYNTIVAPVVNAAQVMFQRADNGQYYNNLDCLVNLDSISRYQLYNSSGNLSNPNRLIVNNSLLSPMVNLFSQVAIVNNPSLSPAVSDFAPYDNMVFQMLFDPSLYTSFDNTYITTATTVNQTNGGVSPIELTFSSLNVSGTTYLNGAGRCSVGIYNREIGYIYQNLNNSTTNTWQFFPASQFEGIQDYAFYVDGNNTVLDQFSDFSLAARIFAKDDTTGIISSFIYRGDQNLTNISDSTMSGYINELKFANQYAKLFADNYPAVNLVKAPVTVSTPVIEGLMQKEVRNLRDYVETSGLFTLISGTTEYRSSKLSFNVYPKDTDVDVISGTLNITFKYDDDVVLNGDVDYSHITDSGDTIFVVYDFTSTTGVFTNVTKSGTFAKNNCASGYNGSLVTYIVSGGTYTGSTQAIADTLATNDVNTNGQAYANTNGTCSIATTYYSAAFAQYVTRNNCGVGYQGSSVLVQYPAGQFTSFISVMYYSY